MNIALLTAAGNGTRMQQDIPKQFMHVDNKPILVYTMEAFQKHPGIDAIIVVCLEGWENVLWAYAKQFNITKLKWIVPGGSTGQESIYCGLCELERVCGEEDVVVIHDGNRAMVSEEIISNAMATYSRHGCAVAVIPCTEAVFKSQDGHVSAEHVKREELWRTQTPHVYALGKLIWAHKEALKREITGTAATCALMNELGERIYFSAGSEKNLKITTVDDIELFKALLHSRKEVWLK